MSQTNAETKRPVKRSEVSKLRWTWEEMKNNKTAYFMLAPFFILFIIKSFVLFILHPHFDRCFISSAMCFGNRLTTVSSLIDR